MEYGAFLSAMTTQKHAAGYFMNNGHTNPTTSIRKSFTPGQIWGPSMWFSEGYTARVAEMYRTRDEDTRKRMIRDLTREAIDAAPYIWLPTPYVHRLVAVGEELQRRTARGRGEAGCGLCAHLDRPGDEEAHGLLSWHSPTEPNSRGRKGRE
jgi:ABC-type transport system substrate-binding protein